MEMEHPSPRETNGRRLSVLVIGGGVSGLAAAAKLSESGNFDVTLLEASNRLGGRVFTKKFGKYFVEMGAEWIHGEQGNRVYELVSGVSPDLLDTNADVEDRYWSDVGYLYVTQGGQVLGSSFNKALTSFMTGMEEDPENYAEDSSLSKAEAATRFAEAAAPLHAEPPILAAGMDWAHRYWNSYDAANHWEETSYNGTTRQYLELPGVPNIPWKFPATYSTLLSLILNGTASYDPESLEIPAWIHLNQEVVCITYNNSANPGSPVTVECRDGGRYFADYVICSVSLGVLKAQHDSLFEPKLPEKKQNAIRNLGFGCVDKICLEFESAWWPEDFKGFNMLWEDYATVNQHWSSDASAEDLLTEHDGIPVWCRNLLGFYAVDGHPTALRTWMTGHMARFMETRDSAYVQSSCHKVMTKFIGHLYRIPEPIGISRTNWYTDPFSRGSYSYRSLESEKANVWANDLAIPVLNHDGQPILCFAGEATSTHYYSSVHGAYDAGIREATRILDCKP